jgi:hypothetical protein
MWQSITSAPFDLPILVTDGNGVYMVKREARPWGVWINPVGFDGPETDCEFGADALTHWMPCPELPT